MHLETSVPSEQTHILATLPDRDYLKSGEKENKHEIDETIEEAMDVMRLLTKQRVYAHSNKDVAALIGTVLSTVCEQATVEDKVKMEVLSLCGELRYNYNDLTSSDRSEMREVIEGIDIGYVSESLARYGDYFFTLADVQLVWKHLSEGRRRQVLSCMSRFGEVGKEGLLGAERLVYGVEDMLILKAHMREMGEGEKRWYERLLNIILEAKYGSTRMSSDERGQTISYALLSQLKALAADRGQKLSEHQMELLYRGLREEWEKKEMRLYEQCLTMLTLGELSIHYKSLPEDLWKIMMKDLVKKMSKGMKGQMVSSLLKGWKGMNVRWSELDEELKEAVMRAVASMNEGRGLANAILYMGNLGMVWKEDVSEENKMRILRGIEKACSEFNGQEVSNTLLGFSKMGVSWKMMNETVGSKLMSVIKRKSEEMKEQEVSNTIYSLGKMGVVANDLPPSMKETLEGSVRRISRMKYPPQGTSNILYGLSKMGYTWQSLGEDTQAALVEMILRSSKEFNAQDVSNTMYGLRGMMKDDKAISEKEYFTPVNKALLIRYYELMQKREVFLFKAKGEVNSYLSWLKALLPSDALKNLGESVAKEITQMN